MSFTRLVHFIIFLIVGLSLSAQHKYPEKVYADYIQTLIGGEREYSITNGRVDLLTESTAFEIEWANKWKESIGQCLWYALNTNKKPGIILIMENDDEFKYYQQLNSAIEYANMKDKIDVYLYPYHFKELMKE